MRTKKLLGWIALIAIGMIVSPGYKCSEYPERCDHYIKDSADLHFVVDQSTNGFNPYDTIRFESVINDTIRTRQGRTILEAMAYPSLQMQGYRVVNGPTGAPTLTYANIEFNPLVQEGQFANYYVSGIGFLYNRQSPYNKLKASLVPGRPGLYLITIRSNNYIDYYRPDENINSPDRSCISIVSGYALSESSRQSHYWDSLGITTLTLQGDGYNVVAKKDDRNYFFIRVNP